MNKQQAPFGENRSPVNVAVDRPTTNSRLGEQVSAEDSTGASTEPLLTFSRHATFGPYSALAARANDKE